MRCPLPGPCTPGLGRLRLPGSLSCGSRGSLQSLTHRDADPGAARLGLRSTAAAAAAAPARRGPAASCKGPALCIRRPALQSHPERRAQARRQHPPHTSCASAPAAQSRPPSSLCSEQAKGGGTAPSLRLRSVASRRLPSPAERPGELTPSEASLVPGSPKARLASRSQRPPRGLRFAVTNCFQRSVGCIHSQSSYT